MLLSIDMNSPLTFLRTAAEGSEQPGLPALGQRQLGRFTLEKELGRGTMGRVYLARDPGTGAEVAIKTLALGREFEGYALQEARARFLREAQAAGRLQHPDIVRIIDSGEEAGWTYIAMELLHGQELSRHARIGQLLPVPVVIRIGARVADALAHAHREGVVHRDIKPANVMYDPTTQSVKVMDFGIARLADGSRTRTGLVLGSPLFMAPEQLVGRPADGRSDLYSLGVMLFQLLTGHLPLHGGTMAELIHSVTQTPAPDPRTHRRSLPEVLCNVVSILLEKRPELRYRDGAEVTEDLLLVASMLERSAKHTQEVTEYTPSSVQEVSPEATALSLSTISPVDARPEAAKSPP